LAENATSEEDIQLVEECGQKLVDGAVSAVKMFKEWTTVPESIFGERADKYYTNFSVNSFKE